MMQYEESHVVATTASDLNWLNPRLPHPMCSTIPQALCEMLRKFKIEVKCHLKAQLHTMFASDNVTQFLKACQVWCYGAHQYTGPLPPTPSARLRAGPVPWPAQPAPQPTKIA